MCALRVTIHRDRIPTIPQDMRALASQAEASFTLAVHSVPWLVIGYDELLRLPLDHRAGHILSLVDGRCTVEMIADMSPLRRDEAIAIIADLVMRGVLAIHDRI
jgi:hypothetical protein